MPNADAVISGRNFWVYSMAWAMGNTFPADTIDYGEPWTGGWEERGYTIGGLTFNANLERGEIRVDQEFDPIVRPVTARNITLSTNLAEMSAENFNLASGMGEIVTVAPGAGTRGHDDLVIGSGITDQYNSWGYDIQQPDGEAFRIVVWKGVASGSPSPSFTPEDAAQIALEVTALPDTSTTPTRIAQIRDVIPAI